MLSRVIILAIFALLSADLFSQTREADSLIRLLPNTPADTNKVKLYWKAGASLIYQDPQKAIPLFKQGIELAQQLRFIGWIERCYNGTSLAFSVNAKYDSALFYINLAVPYAIKAGDKRRLTLAYLNRADVYTNLQDFRAALKDCDTAMRYAEQSGSKDGMGRIYSIISGIYRSQKQYELSLNYMEKSEALFREVNNMQMVAMMHSERADLLVQLDQIEKSIPFYLQAIHIADSLEDIENLSAYYGGLAQSYVRTKKYADGEKAARQALGYAQQTGNTGQQAVMYNIFYNVEMEKKNYDGAIDYALKSYTLVKTDNDLMREQVYSASLAEAYHKAGNINEAYKYLKISRDLNDSLIKQQFNNETAQLQTQFDVSQKNKEIQLLSKERELQHQRLQKQRFLMLGFFILALLALAGIWLLMNRNKLRQRMKELELRNRIAADLHDEVGSSLSSIHMLSQMVTQGSSDERQKDVLQKMSSNAKETMDKMGDIVWMIKPGESEAVNLKQRMERFAYEICGSKNISCSLELSGLDNLKFTMDQRKNIYLVFKESVNNAVKYSGTDKMEVAASVHQKQLLLRIHDFGRGFNLSEVVAGNGLENIRNRATELRGRLEIETSPNNGTSIHLVIPV